MSPRQGRQLHPNVIPARVSPPQDEDIYSLPLPLPTADLHHSIISTLLDSNTDSRTLQLITTHHTNHINSQTTFTMDKAKAAVSDFMSKAGKHDTTVDETVAPAVTNETINKTHHENVTGAVDREVHQDHYHTTVQPIQHREVLPEQHTHRAAAVEHREHHHGDSAAVKQKLEQEAAQFRNTTTQGQTTHTHSEAPVIAGEHRHHHVHEVIQPVVQKETIQPTVTHTTVPVHEVHHNAAQHHSASKLPAMTMDEFKSQGGSLAGREARHDGFAGEPRAVAGASGTTGSSTTGSHSATTGSHSATHGTTGASGVGATGAGVGSTATGSSATGTSSTGTKPSLGQKLNPKVDADGDGKAGFMS